MNKAILTSVGILLLGLAVTGSAAVNPSVSGATSQGSMDVNLNLNPQVSITGLTDIAINYANAAAAMKNSTVGYMPAPENFCVYSSVGSYSLTVTTQNGSQAYDPGSKRFALSRGAPADKGRIFSYSIDYKGGDQNVDSLEYGQTYTGFTGSTESACTSTNAALTFHIFQELPGATIAQGLYRDTVNVTVAAV